MNRIKISAEFIQDCLVLNCYNTADNVKILSNYINKNIKNGKISKRVFDLIEMFWMNEYLFKSFLSETELEKSVYNTGYNTFRIWEIKK